MSLKDPLKSDFFQKLDKCEREFIVHIFHQPEEILELSQIVKPSDFYTLERKQIYATALQAQLEDKDVLLELGKKDIKIGEYLAYPHVPRNMSGLAKEIAESKKRMDTATLFFESYENIFKGSLEEFINKFQREFADASRITEKERSNIDEIIKDFNKEQEIYTEKILNGDGIIGMSSGFDKLDKIIDGLRPGHLWTVGGYTSSGKTFFSLNILAQLISEGKRCVYFSLEMSKIDIVSRLLGIMTGINGMKILKGLATPEEKIKIDEAKKLIVDSGLSIYANVNELSSIKMSINYEKMKSDVDVVMLDYVQLVKSGKQSEYETMKETAIDFQALSGKLKIPFILLSQISNEAAKSPEGRIIGFKGAGDIAAASDLAIELMPGEDDMGEYRRKMNEGENVTIKCVVKKNRHGSVGTMLTSFTGHTGKFTEITTGFDDI